MPRSRNAWLQSHGPIIYISQWVEHYPMPELAAKSFAMTPRSTMSISLKSSQVNLLKVILSIVCSDTITLLVFQVSFFNYIWWCIPIITYGINISVWTDPKRNWGLLASKVYYLYIVTFSLIYFLYMLLLSRRIVLWVRSSTGSSLCSIDLHVVDISLWSIHLYLCMSLHMEPCMDLWVAWHKDGET